MLTPGRFTKKQLLAGAAVAGLLLAAAGLSLYRYGLRKPVATPTIVVRQAAGELPLDPWAPAWKKVSGANMPLSIVNTPGAVARQVKVQALTDGTNLAMRLEWADNSKDVTTIRPQDFGDAAAFQLSDRLVNACMGQLEGLVHIWQWKADWQEGTRDMRAQYPNMLNDGFHDDTGKALLTEDLFTRPAFVAGNKRAAATKDSPVEYLVAGGFGTLTPAGSYPVQGKGAYDQGKWAVVFVRPLKGEQGDVTLAAGAPLQAAFAVWDGSQMQRDGMKYVTNWAVLQMEGK
ncbi:MAG TPA: ethylbenzene dehydrogenase-related protein [Symbiobacteriaceae bacterium]|nr:ethylbenzene dehydrogenase-related protein [Symbiobacteriaceae bacterium]